MISKTAFAQVLRYGVVGILSNSIGYMAYMAIVATGVGHKLAMSLVYSAVFMMSFYGNRKFTFDQGGRIAVVGLKFIAVYAFGYVVNLFLLFVFVDFIGYKHEFVQLASIGVIAALSFVLLKFFVFIRR